VTWAIVEGFVQWLLAEGYAASSVSSGLSVVRAYSQLAVKAGAKVDEKRAQTRIDNVTYDYKPDGRKRRVVVTRQSTKKARLGLLNVTEAAALIQLSNDSAHAWRDALLMWEVPRRYSNRS
jgi:hypothetical protein